MKEQRVVPMRASEGPKDVGHSLAFLEVVALFCTLVQARKVSHW
jgi:hypothetical protein